MGRRAQGGAAALPGVRAPAACRPRARRARSAGEAGASHALAEEAAAGGARGEPWSPGSRGPGWARACGSRVSVSLYCSRFPRPSRRVKPVLSPLGAPF